MKKTLLQRRVLLAGSTVFGFSALLLLISPRFFDDLLGLPPSSPLEWSMRMIGITLVALAGNMFSVSRFGSERSVNFSAVVMMVAATSLGFLTLDLPSPFTWFTIAYSVVGFSFGLAYAISIVFVKD
jgi:O-antigen/teichoic acid export membrane protein